MAISYPFIKGREIVLQRIELDLSGIETVEEKEALYRRWASHLHALHYPTIVAVGIEPDIYVEIMSEMWDEQIGCQTDVR